MSHQEHSDLVDELLIRLNPYGRFFKNSVGVGVTLDGKSKVRYGWKHFPDVIGFTNEGTFAGLEVKTGRAVLDPDQRRARQTMESRGCIHVEARDLQSCLDELRSKILRRHGRILLSRELGKL